MALTLSNVTVWEIVRISQELSDLEDTAAKEHGPVVTLANWKTPEGYEDKRAELLKAIMALPAEQQCELQALMWLGRGEFDTFQDALRSVKGNDQDPHGRVGYIAEKPLHEYLPAGLRRLRREGLALVE